MKKHTQIATYFIAIFILCPLFIGCTVLNEAQQRREKRLQEKKQPDLFLLKPSKANIKVDEQALHGESDHYGLTFAENLRAQDEFDEVAERKSYAISAMSYMESLYEAMYDIFGFKPEHQIKVILHHTYLGTTRVATTRTQSREAVVGGELVKKISAIQIDFPINMYQSIGTRIHELTHAFTNIYYLPVWFSEGIAVLMQREYGRDRQFVKFDSLERNLKLDNKGMNQLENWGGHADIGGALTMWRYNYAYSVVSELRKRYGHDFYIKVFDLMQKDRLHEKLSGSVSTSFVVYYFSQVAGEDLVPFFKKLQFDVQKLEKSDILKQIEQTKKKF